MLLPRKFGSAGIKVKLKFVWETKPDCIWKVVGSRSGCLAKLCIAAIKLYVFVNKNIENDDLVSFHGLRSFVAVAFRFPNQILTRLEIIILLNTKAPSINTIQSNFMLMMPTNRILKTICYRILLFEKPKSRNPCGQRTNLKK